MNFIDICSGIGGFRTGLERNGHNCIAFAEIDKYAIKSYKAIYDTENEVELEDITTMEDSEWEQFKGNCDMIVGGTPCQSFSIAGKRLGFEDTRGTVFFSYVNAIKQVQPKYFLFENVKGLMSHDKGNTIKVILKAFDEVGYDLDFEIFNSKYYGVPQNRERIYIVGVRKDLSDKPFKQVAVGKKKMDLLKAWATCEVSYKQIYPTLQTEVTTRLIDVLEDEVDEKYYLSEEKTQKLKLDESLGGKLNHFNYNEMDRVYSIEKVSPTLNTMQGGNRQPKVAVVGNTLNTGYGSENVHSVEGISPTIQARDYKGAKQIAVKEDNQGEVINPLKDKTEYGWHFEQAVYDPQGITRTVKANGGSGNIPKTIEGKHAPKTSQQNVIIDDTQGYDGVRYYEGVAPTIRSSRSGLKTIEVKQDAVLGVGHHPFSKKREFRGFGLICPTLIATDYKAPKTALTNDLRIRKLTPLECWRLQGFSDEQFYKAKNSGVSNSQLYKQAGNSVTVNVVDAIVKELD